MADSVQVAPLAVRKQNGLFLGLALWQGVALLLLIVWLYASILARLFTQWRTDPNASHGFFVPAFAVFVLWKNWSELKSIKPAPSWSGLTLMIGALALLILGDLGAEIFLSRVSLLFVLAGLIVLFHGWPWFRAVLFPWAFLFLMIPIPVIVFQEVTFPLQILASKLASAALPVLGVVVHREGNVIQLATMHPLQVVSACSGIRSLLSLVTLAVIYGYLMEDRQWVRIVLAIAAVPIALVANSFRVVGAGLISLWDPEKAEGFFHTFEGWLIFVVSLLMLFAVHSLITRIWKGPREVRHA
jgi:exosortase